MGDGGEKSAKSEAANALAARCLKPTRTGRKPHAVEPLKPSVTEIIRAVKMSEPAHVQRLLLHEVNTTLDEELEEMAKWVASEWDPDLDTDRLKSLLAGGQHRMAVNAIVAQVRRELVEELRKHKRSSIDALLVL